MTLIQKLAVSYAFLFFGVVAIGYITAFNDANGNLFGLSKRVHDHFAAA